MIELLVCASRLILDASSRPRSAASARFCHRHTGVSIRPSSLSRRARCTTVCPRPLSRIGRPPSGQQSVSYWAPANAVGVSSLLQRIRGLHFRDIGHPVRAIVRIAARRHQRETCVFSESLSYKPNNFFRMEN